MDKEEASKRFRKLATSDKRPATARLRDIFDDVEVALKARVPHIAVLAELKDLGFTMEMASFKSALQRIRKERKQSKIETAPTVQAVQPVSPVIPDGGDSSVPEAPQAAPIPQGQEQGTGFVDIFALQEEREAKKNSEKKIQKIPRR